MPSIYQEPWQDVDGERGEPGLWWSEDAFGRWWWLSRTTVNGEDYETWVLYADLSDSDRSDSDHSDPPTPRQQAQFAAALCQSSLQLPTAAPAA